MSRTGNNRTTDLMWKETREEIHRRTGFDIGTDAGKLPDHVIQELEAKYSPEETHEKREKTKQVLDNVLKSINNIGGIAAQAASTLIGPASMCFNAVSFLVEGVARIKKLHSNLIEMFEYIHTLLFEFESIKEIEYWLARTGQTTPPAPLIAITNELMSCFTKICVFVLKDVDDGKVKRLVKRLVTFTADDDGGAQAELTKLEKLINQKNSFTTNLAAVETLKHGPVIERIDEGVSRTYSIANRTHSIANRTNETLSKYNDRQDKEAQLDDLREGLALGDKKRNVVRDQRKRLDEIRHDRVKSTGEWLLDLPSYKSWFTLQPGSDTCLILHGEKDTGKSYIASRVVDDWKTHSSERQCCVAHHFFGETAGSDEGGKREEMNGKGAFCTALRSMAFQLADQNPSFRRDLLKLINTRSFVESVDDAAKLWNQLGFTNENRDATFVLIFAGLEKLDGAHDLLSVLQGTYTDPRKRGQDTSDGSVSASPKSTRLRILIAMNRRHVQGGPPDSVTQELSLSSENNRPDLAKFIDWKIQTSDNLKILLENEKALVDQFKERLLSESDGRYSRVELHIGIVDRKVSEPGSFEELRQFMLGNLGKIQSEVTRRIFQNLEDSKLQESDIAQINNVLAWLVWGLDLGPKNHMDEFTMEQIEAITRLDPSNDILFGFTRKMERQQTYRELFYVRKAGARRYVGVHRYVLQELRNPRNAEHERDAISDFTDEPSISAEIKVHKLDAKSVRRVMWRLHDKEFSDQTLSEMTHDDGENKARIEVSEIKSYSEIIPHCLNILTAEPAQSTRALLQHCTENLPHYLTRARELELEVRQSKPDFELRTKREIVLSLMDLLMDADTIVEHLRDANVPGHDWFNEDSVASLRWWLDEENCRGLSLRPPSQRKRNRLCPGGAIATFLQPITEQIASGWLREGTWDAESAFDWVDRFLLIMWPQVSKNVPESTFVSTHDTSPEKPAGTQQDGSETSNNAEIVDTAEKSGAKPPDYRLDVPVEGRIRMAVTWAKHVLKIDDEGLIAVPLSRTYLDFELFGLAIDLLEPMVAQEGTRGFEVYENLAEAYKCTGDYEKAIEAQTAATEMLLESDQKEKPAKLRHTRRTLAALLSEAGRVDEAFVQLDRQLHSDMFDARSAYQILALCQREKRFDVAASWFAKLAGHQGDEDEHGRPLNAFANMFYEVSSRVDLPTRSFLELGSRVNSLKYMIQALEAAFERLLSRKEEGEAASNFALSKLQLNIGIAWSLHLQNLEGTRREIDGIKKAHEYYSERFWLKQLRGHMARCRYDEIMTSDHKDKALRQLEDLVKDVDYTLDDNWSPAPLLIHCFATSGRVEEAEQLLRPHLSNSMELLLDTDRDNDIFTYVALGRGLGCIDDVGNSIAAWSLVASFQSRWSQKDNNRRSRASFREMGEVVQYQSGLADETLIRTDENGTGERREEGLTDDAADRQQSTKSAEPTNPAAEDSSVASDETETEARSAGPSKSTRSESTTVRKLSSPPPTSTSGLYLMGCDGRCGKIWERAGDFWTCQACSQVDLCSECYRAYKKGTLGLVRCSTTHSFFHVPSWSSEVHARAGEDEILIPHRSASGEWSFADGEVKKLEDWLNEIRDRFGIERPGPTPLAPSRGSDVEMLPRVKSPDPMQS